MKTFEQCQAERGSPRLMVPSIISNYLPLLDPDRVDALALTALSVSTPAPSGTITPSTFESTIAVRTPTPYLSLSSGTLSAGLPLGQTISLDIPDRLRSKLRDAGKRIRPPKEPDRDCRHIAAEMERAVPELTYYVYICFDVARVGNKLIGVKSKWKKIQEAAARNDDESLRKLWVTGHAVNDYHPMQGSITLIEEQEFVGSGYEPHALFPNREVDLNGDNRLDEVEVGKTGPFTARICYSWSFNSYADSVGGERCIPE